MPRGKPKRGEFDFTIWFQDGARIQWKSNRPQTDAAIAAAIREYLFPIVERLEATTNADCAEILPLGGG
jgi:hypothetical protein